jgi:hypothetical protein
MVFEGPAAVEGILALADEIEETFDAHTLLQ